jgi:hypothetical protein
VLGATGSDGMEALIVRPVTGADGWWARASSCRGADRHQDVVTVRHIGAELGRPRGPRPQPERGEAGAKATESETVSRRHGGSAPVYCR